MHDLYGYILYIAFLISNYKHKKIYIDITDSIHTHIHPQLFLISISFAISY